MKLAMSGRALTTALSFTLTILSAQHALAQSAPAAEAPKVEAPKTEAPAPGEWANRFSMSGRSFWRFQYNLSDLPETDNGKNEFKFDRVYLSANAKLWEGAQAVLTFEGGDVRDDSMTVSSTTDETTGAVTSVKTTTSLLQYDVVTKLFYLEQKDFLTKGVWLQVGQIPVLWHGYEESLYGYRMQGTIMVDRMGYMTSTDLGVALGGKLPSDMGSVALGVYNGEGWKKPEADRHKDIQARLSLQPLGFMKGPAKGLHLGGYYHVGEYDDVTDSLPDDGLDPSTVRTRMIGFAGFKMDGKVALGGLVFKGSDPTDKMKGRYLSADTVEAPEGGTKQSRVASAMGYSAWATLSPALFLEDKTLGKLELMARMDHLQPDVTVDGTVDLLIAGLSYKANKHLQLLLDLEQLTYGGKEKELREAAKKYDSRVVMLQADLKF